MPRILLVCALVWFATPCQAWHVNTHLQMTRDAVSMLPPEFQKIFTEHQRFVEQGIRDPDEMVKDWANHYYIPGDVPEGGAIDRIEKLIAIAQNKIKTGNTFDMGRQLTYISHYVGDLWTPEYLIKQNTAPDQRFIQEHEVVVFFPGYVKPIENFHEYFKQRAQWRWRVERSHEIEPLLYSEAVGDIVRTWMTLWEMAGKETPELQSAAIVHEKGTIAVNFQRLLQEEKYSPKTWDPNRDWMSNYESHNQEVNRLNENVNPSDSTMLAKAELRKQQQQLSKLTPKEPFEMLETSLKLVGDKNYLITRVRNKSEQDIESLALMYPGIKGPVAHVNGLKPGQVALLEAELPPTATKNNLQVIFAAPE